MTKSLEKIVKGGKKTHRPGLPWPLWIVGLIIVIGAILVAFGG